MHNRCTTPSAPRPLTTEGEKPFSPPFTRSKAPFPQAFPEKKTGSYAPKHQDHSIKQGDFLHAFHSLYTSPSQTLSIRKKKSFLLLEKWLIYNESGVEKTISAENCGGSSVESGDLRCPSRRTPKADTDHGKATAGVGHILHEKQNFGRKKRFSFRICRKTFYFCTLKYHALTAPLCASAHSLDRISRQHVTHVPFAFARCCAAPGRRRTDLVPERRHENRKRFGRLCRHEFQNRTTQTQGLPSHERQPERQRGHSRGERRTLSLHHRSAAGRHLQY